MARRRAREGDDNLNTLLADACVGGGAFPGPEQENSAPCDQVEIRRLVNAGANIDEARAIHVAASNDQPVAVKLLARLGGNVSLWDPHGNAPLHVAAGMQQVRTIEALIESGAMPGETNAAGATPLQLAAKAKREASGFVNSLIGGRQPASAAAARTKARDEAKWAKISQLLGGGGAPANNVPPPGSSQLAGRDAAGKRNEACPQCKKVTSDYPENDPGMAHRAYCNGCDEDLGCNECWVEHGSFCEGCNIFECDECQKNWNHMYGPTGAVGISCNSCRPRGARYNDGLMEDLFGPDGGDEDDEEDEEEDEEEALGRFMGWNR